MTKLSIDDMCDVISVMWRQQVRCVVKFACEYVRFINTLICRTETVRHHQRWIFSFWRHCRRDSWLAGGVPCIDTTLCAGETALSSSSSSSRVSIRFLHRLLTEYSQWYADRLSSLEWKPLLSAQLCHLDVRRSFATRLRRISFTVRLAVCNQPAAKLSLGS